MLIFLNPEVLLSWQNPNKVVWLAA